MKRPLTDAQRRKAEAEWHRDASYRTMRSIVMERPMSASSAREENMLSAIRAMNKAAPARGCICPPTSERTCQSPTCPRLPPARQEMQAGKLVWVRP